MSNRLAGTVRAWSADLGWGPALPGEQDLQQAAADAVGAVQQAHQVAGQAELAYTLVGRILQVASSGRLTCGSSNDPRGYFIW